MKAFIALALILISFLFCYHARSQQLPESYRSVRALGMGNAYTSVVDDGDALFYNPTALALIRGINWTILDPSVGIDDIQSITGIIGSKANNFADTLGSLYGKRVWLGIGLKSAMSFPGVGVGGFGQTELSVGLSNPAFPEMPVVSTTDYGVAAGAAFDLIPNITSLGIVFRRVSRIGGKVVFGPGAIGLLDSDSLKNQLANKGTGYGMDLGFSFMIPSPVSPRFSLVWKNVGKTSFRGEGTSIAPPPIEEEIVVGFATRVKLPLTTITPAVDFKHINQTTEQLGKKVHLGLEISFLTFDLRGGIHQGYYTYGFGLNLGILRFDAATYGVELGTYPGQLEDRRYLAQLTLGFGFDPTFGVFSGSGNKGGKSPLKQRR